LSQQNNDNEQASLTLSGRRPILSNSTERNHTIEYTNIIGYGKEMVLKGIPFSKGMHEILTSNNVMGT
jgi:hypothetical protein